VAIIMAIRAYSLSKQGEAGDATRLFSEAKKQDRQNWTVALVRGWSNLGSKRYSSAKSDFQMALSLSNNSQAEPLEAMALLLAACPDDKIRNGEKAVKHAAKACELTNQKDWVCLDTLGAAYAEAGDFDAAVKSAQKATKLAPEDRQELIRERIEFYGNKVPYRWK
jgi:Flp pilus assembly protein TadD